jgi:hypothetical protein
MSQKSKPNVFRIPTDVQGRLRAIKADLIDQKIKPFPSGTAGRRARSLWREIRSRLRHGVVVEITGSALGLDWHRQELKRARDDLVQMDLIKPRADGNYMLGSFGPFSRIDELIRDQFFALEELEQVLIAICAISAKSKTQRKRGRS